MKHVIGCLALVGFVGCTDTPVASLASLGLACDRSHACPAGTECGTCGIGLGQCVSPCSMTGSDGCPTGAYCSEAWTNTTTHICVRQCASGNDVDCRTPVNNQALSCNDPYVEPGTQHDDIFVCGTETATSASCP